MLKKIVTDEKADLEKAEREFIRMEAEIKDIFADWGLDECLEPIDEDYLGSGEYIKLKARFERYMAKQTGASDLMTIKYGSPTVRDNQSVGGLASMLSRKDTFVSKNLDFDKFSQKTSATALARQDEINHKKNLELFDNLIENCNDVMNKPVEFDDEMLEKIYTYNDDNSICVQRMID